MDELRKGFHHELDEIRAESAQLIEVVIDSIPRATRALLDGDLDSADKMIRADEVLNARCLELEERCYRLLALQAPVASDLRQVIAIVKIVSEIERSGDLAVNICKAARRIYGHNLNSELQKVITEMGEQATQLFTAALEAFRESDAAKAAAIDDMDSYLDGLQRQFIRVILESHSAGNINVQVAIQLAVVARFLERIGDHAVNISERVRYFVTGWLPENLTSPRSTNSNDDTDGIPFFEE